jgi:endonuclease-3
MKKELKTVLGKLDRLHPARETLSDPLALILWENIGYLIDDERRAALFSEFTKSVGLDAERIARAPKAVLRDIAQRGGMNPTRRVERWRNIARIVLESCGGDLLETLRALPPAKARALLKKFPSVGDPGADRILLFSNIEAQPSVESNGLRVLVRLGFCEEEKSYGATYKAATTILRNAMKGNAGRLKSAYTSLRQHGKTLCKRSNPQCLACPLDALCAHAPVKAL